MNSKSIGELQAEIEAALARIGAMKLPPELRALAHLVPAGMTPRVSLRYADDHRQIRRTADASYWDPMDCVATISFEEEPDDAPSQRKADASSSFADDTFRDLVTALDRAEREPRFREFVGLKNFRDQYLPQLNFPWAAEIHDRHRELARAIEQQLILTGKVPNPKSPQNPVTKVILNRDHPQVTAILKSTQTERSPFHPRPIRGEGLSASIVAERR
jgi:hypothetical protein